MSKNDPVSQRGTSLPANYQTFLLDLKARIHSAQMRAALAVNRELIQLYWDLGRAIASKQQSEGWGAKVIDRLGQDLQREFPGIAGFSRGNIYRMRAFYLAYEEGKPIVAQLARQLPPDQNSNEPIVAQPVRQLPDGVSKSRKKEKDFPRSAQPIGQLPTESLSPPTPVSEIPWGHNIVLIEMLKDRPERLWYAQQSITHGWSRNMLVHWIESGLYGRQGKAVTNFSTTLPPEQSDLAQQIIKDPYNFDFLTLHADALERELEEGLLERITRFLLELGEGFAFVGRQVHLEVGGEDFYIDLLFYHLRLHAFVIIDLKTGQFKPEYAGKINFYLSAVDDQMRQEGDKSSIGLILCKMRNKVVAEYALRHLHQPVGVARYVTKLTEKLPSDLAGKLPTVKQIEAELAKKLSKQERKKREDK